MSVWHPVMPLVINSLVSEQRNNILYLYLFKFVNLHVVYGQAYKFHVCPLNKYKNYSPDHLKQYFILIFMFVQLVNQVASVLMEGLLRHPLFSLKKPVVYQGMLGSSVRK